MAFDAFLFIPDASAGTPAIKVIGETTDGEYKNKKAIELYSFSFGASNPQTVGSASTGSGGGKVSLSSFNVMKKTDAATPALFLVCAKGDHFKKMCVTLRKAGGKQIEFINYTFTQVYVDSIQWSGSSGGDDSPTESISFSYGAFKLDYWAQKADGTRDEAVKSQVWSQISNKPELTEV